MTTTPEPNVSAAVATRDSSPGGLLEQYKGDFALVLPSHVKPDTFVRLALGALRRDDKLRQAAANNTAAFLGAVLTAARLGLEPGTEQFYLTPRKVKGQFEVLGIVGYQGEIELIYRAGAVSSVSVEVVHERDTFVWRPGAHDTHSPPRWEGPQRQPFHEADWFGDRGPMLGVYAFAQMKDGAVSRVVVLAREDIERIKRSSAGSGDAYSPWKLHEKAMWLKSAVHQLRKWVPTSAEYRAAMQEQSAKAETAAVRLDLPPTPPSVDSTTGEILEQGGADVVEAEIVGETLDGSMPSDRAELIARLATASLAVDPEADWAGEFYGEHDVSVEDAPIPVLQQALRGALARAAGDGG